MTNEPLAVSTWKDNSFDDSAWKTGQAPFGNDIVLEYGHRKEEKPKIDNWNTNHIYLRRTVEFNEYLTPQTLNNLGVKTFYDDDVEIYINGVLAYSSDNGFLKTYEYFPVSKEAINAVKLGEPNEIAVYCRQGFGGQFIDVGFCVMDIDRSLFPVITDL